ncbi:Pyruvate kinase, partial [Trachipleistophora hominis]
DVLIDDGKLRMVVDLDGDEIVCVAMNDHMVKPNKAVNIPDMKMDKSVPTEKDKNDIFLGLKNKIDYVFLSFVSNAAEIRKVRDFIRDMNGHMPVLIAKIENKEAIRNINEIIEEADGIMIARGDLAVEIGIKHCFSAQKMITKKCLVMKKPFIMATQMLESMTEESTPTRAEVSDVGNAVLDNCDCVMLSGETASGRHPAHVVRTMKTIISDAEFFKYGEQWKKSRALLIFMHHYSDHVIELKYSYKVPLVVISNDESILRRVGHHAGFFCFKMENDETREQTIKRIKQLCGIDEYEWIVVGDENDCAN